MEQSYRHVQYSAVLIFALGVASVILFAIALWQPHIAIAWGMSGALLACLILFYSLCVVVDEGYISWRFGAGVFGASLLLGDIASVKIVVNPWYYGLGVHFTPDGWLYNIAGSNAIEMITHNNRKIRLGTDEPEKLIAALLQENPSIRYHH